MGRTKGKNRKGDEGHAFREAGGGAAGKAAAAAVRSSKLPKLKTIRKHLLRKLGRDPTAEEEQAYVKVSCVWYLGACP